MPKRKVFRKVVTLSKVVERREKIDIESLLDAGFDGDADECQEEELVIALCRCVFNYRLRGLNILILSQKINPS